MAQTRNFLEVASVAAAQAPRFLASIPSGADNAIIRADVGTYRWSESNGSWLNASIGILMSAADPPFRVGGPPGLAAFSFVAVGGAAAINVAYYTYTGIGLYQ
jgi:hypothetical protein